jgi:ferritin
MMIPKKVASKLNEQVKNEFYSEWLYLAMAFAFESMNLSVFAKWFYLQAKEEHEHAMKIAKYLLDQGAEVKLQALPEPKASYKSAEEICAATVDHEKLVTRQIHELFDLARAEKDAATQVFLNWFVEEQVEEVASLTHLYEMVKLAKTPGQIMMLEGPVYRMVEERKK